MYFKVCFKCILNNQFFFSQLNKMCFWSFLRLYLYISYIVLTYLEAIRHGLSEPNVLLLFDVLASVPVLHGNGVLRWAEAGLPSLHVAEDFDGIQRRALVGIHPVETWQETVLSEFQSTLSTIYPNLI